MDRTLWRVMIAHVLEERRKSHRRNSFKTYREAFPENIDKGGGYVKMKYLLRKVGAFYYYAIDLLTYLRMRASAGNRKREKRRKERR